MQNKCGDAVGRNTHYHTNSTQSAGVLLGYGSMVAWVPADHTFVLGFVDHVRSLARTKNHADCGALSVSIFKQ
jgi:hypothetical protein